MIASRREHGKNAFQYGVCMVLAPMVNDVADFPGVHATSSFMVQVCKI
jgi:hypothetical protein